MAAVIICSDFGAPQNNVSCQYEKAKRYDSETSWLKTSTLLLARESIPWAGLSWNAGTWASWPVWSQAPPIPWEPPLCLSTCSWQWCDWSCMETQGSQERKSSSFQTLIMSRILSTPKIYCPSTLLERRVRPILTSWLD